MSNFLYTRVIVINEDKEEVSIPYAINFDNIIMIAPSPHNKDKTYLISIN